MPLPRFRPQVIPKVASRQHKSKSKGVVTLKVRAGGTKRGVSL